MPTSSTRLRGRGALGICGHGDTNRVAASGHREANLGVSVASFVAPFLSPYSSSSSLSCASHWCVRLVVALAFQLTTYSHLQWARPPNIVIGGDNSTSAVTTQSIETLSDGIQVNLGLDVEVVNPNYFSVELSSVTADILYPINNTRIGNGTFKNLKLPAHSRTNFTFPFMFAYQQSIDPNLAIITDLASKCLGSQQSNLSLRYRITVAVKVFFFTISPTISNSISFACPISSSDLQNIAQEVGLNLKKIIGSISA